MSGTEYPITATSGVPLYSPLIYNPSRRYEAWRFLSYMLLHQGYVPACYHLLHRKTSVMNCKCPFFSSHPNTLAHRHTHTHNCTHPSARAHARAMCREVLDSFSLPFVISFTLRDDIIKCQNSLMFCAWLQVYAFDIQPNISTFAGYSTRNGPQVVENGNRLLSRCHRWYVVCSVTMDRSVSVPKPRNASQCVDHSAWLLCTSPCSINPTQRFLLCIFCPIFLKNGSYRYVLELTCETFFAKRIVFTPATFPVVFCNQVIIIFPLCCKKSSCLSLAASFFGDTCG